MVGQVVENAPLTEDELQPLLKYFYGRLFPAKLMYKWLGYGYDTLKQMTPDKKDYFLRREVSFTLRDDVYVRYQCWNSPEAFQKDLVDRVPYKIDIGAVFSAPPKQKNSIDPSAFVPRERELVFDIDMTDYDDVRVCCSGAAICKTCWPLMTLAVKILDTALRNDFGFKHLLWVYSGRRGIHCWVSDERARKLTPEGRSSVAEFLAVHTGNADNKRILSLTSPLHPSLQRVYSEHLEPYFVKHVLPQDMFASKTTTDAKGEDVITEPLLDCLAGSPFENAINTLRREWADADLSSAEKWEQLNAKLGKVDKGPMYLQNIVFTYTYPRLDIHVSKGINHLLKSPFCVHPKTGLVCVPFDPKNVDEFDPFNRDLVPHIRDLPSQVNDFDKKNPQSSEGEEGAAMKKVTDAKKTQMKNSINVFKEFVNGLLSEVRAANLAAVGEGGVKDESW